MREPNQGTAYDLAQVGVTLAAIAVALATFQPNNLVARAFLLFGLSATVGTGYAMQQIWIDSGMTAPRQLFFLDAPAGMGPRFSALVYLAWAIVGITLTYFVMLITTIR